MITKFNKFECSSQNYFTSTETKDIWEKFNTNICNFLHFKKQEKLMICLNEYISRGYDIDYYRYFYPLLIKVSGNYDATKLLIDAGANVNIKTNGNFTALMNSIVENNNYDVFELLLENGANLNIKTTDKNWDVFDIDNNKNNKNKNKNNNNNNLRKYVKNKYPNKYKEYLINKDLEKFNI